MSVNFPDRRGMDMSMQNLIIFTVYVGNISTSISLLLKGRPENQALGLCNSRGELADLLAGHQFVAGSGIKREQLGRVDHTQG